MKHFLIKFLRSILLIIVIVALAGPYVFLSAHVHVKRRHNVATPADYGMKFDHITTKTSDGILLDGWFIPVKDSKVAKGTMIACHGVGANKSNILKVTEILHNGDYEIYQFDFRGHGESGDSIITYGYNEKKDVKAIIKYAKEHGARKLGLFGLSMGGSIVLLSTPEHPEIKAVIADSAYASTERVMKYRIGLALPWPAPEILTALGKFYSRTFFFIPIEKIAPIDTVKDIHRPILFIAGDKDTNITPDNSFMLYKKANKPKELFIVKGANHTQTMSDPEYKVIITNFLNKYLN